ncbi:hypothetical protein SODALDRAFT_375842 [Sodiomyces alkalinus F11]|uniref:Phosphoinositide phospholipase C n=1 Tax=Sodiomyces alkalinus (strain CBS 110278 / VKM F-3762 / F11) TaxID=1314773 RepID=A0A3N2QAC0_SODAK|nr:hypothetical protein SODALDRAFT_375842 [Sodiomyces alkalinus F11]ROT43699.1 hypothetical protein SODALDRAFT_375842 [Sodiomyces alkalinus F11]
MPTPTHALAHPAPSTNNLADVHRSAQQEQPTCQLGRCDNGICHPELIKTLAAVNTASKTHPPSTFNPFPSHPLCAHTITTQPPTSSFRLVPQSFFNPDLKKYHHDKGPATTAKHREYIIGQSLAFQVQRLAYPICSFPRGILAFIQGNEPVLFLPRSAAHEQGPRTLYTALHCTAPHRAAPYHREGTTPLQPFWFWGGLPIFPSLESYPNQTPAYPSRERQAPGRFPSGQSQAFNSTGTILRPQLAPDSFPCRVDKHPGRRPALPAALRRTNPAASQTDPISCRLHTLPLRIPDISRRVSHLTRPDLAVLQGQPVKDAVINPPRILHKRMIKPLYFSWGNLAGRSLTPSSSSSGNRTMTPQTVERRYSRPTSVQTNNLNNTSTHNQQPSMPGSAISASSATSSSRQGSPLMSPDATAVMTSSSSVQPSPEPLRGQDFDDATPSGSFQLPESLLCRRTSNTSLPQSLSSTAPSAVEPLPAKSGGLIRRLSNRAARPFTRRRPSSAASTSRDGSVGPGMLRRRSDSNATAPPEFPLVPTDSEDESIYEPDECRSQLTFDGSLKESPSNSTPASVAGSTPSGNATAGPVIPFQLLKGTWIRKVSKKNRAKRFVLVLEPDAARISWDKSRPHKCLYIDDIKEIRTGTDIRQYRLDFGVPESEESRWFSVLYAVPDKSKSKMMHLVADDASVFSNWVTTLEAISKHRQDLMASLMAFNDRAIRDYWRSEMAKQFADKPHSPDEEELDYEGVQNVCRKLHIHASPSQLFAKFHAADATKTGRLNYFEFQSFVGFMKRRDDIRSLYQSLAENPEAGLSLDEFLSFLRDVQGEDIETDLPAWEAIYAKLSRKFRPRDAERSGAIAHSDSPRMNDAAFAAYLTSTFNLPLKTEPKEYTLDRPINEYFISSSHNTYLLGRQVAGLSSVEGYIAALARGCRCVEVDCWNGADGQPTVNHGRTLTTSISFQETMTTINKYAFVKTHYPLWISLEVHCNPQQQAIMSRIMKETFGSRLVTEPLDPSSDKLPSPEQLKDRILIKVKKPQLKEEPKAPEPGRRRGNSLTSPYSKPIQLDNALIPPLSLPQSPLLGPSTSSRRLVGKTRVNTITEGEVKETLSSSSTSDNDSAGERVPARRSSNKTVKVLGDLGVYCAGVKFRGFDTPDAKAYNHIFSFMESSFEKHGKPKEAKHAMDRHNMRYLMRVYPDGIRYTSTNFDPLHYWRRGVQMAALNWQTFDSGMQINQAMFDSGTDRSGYVLKPSELREIQVMPEGWSGKRERKEVSFSIGVISAQQLMRPNGMPANRTVDPYVEVEVFHANDKRNKKEADPTVSLATDSPLKYRTRVIRENGFNPAFNDRFDFRVTTKYPDLIFVRWSVKLSHNGEAYNEKPPVATFTAKLSGLKAGYRTLPLFDHNGEQYLFSTLFCNIKMGPVNSVLLDCPGDQPDTSGKLRGLGRTITRFNRPNNVSPKSSLDRSSFESPQP